MPNACLTDDMLLPLATGEGTAAAGQEHLRACPECQERLRRLESEIRQVRDSFHDADSTLRQSLQATPVQSMETAVPGEGDSPVFAETKTGTVPTPTNIGRYRVIGLLDSGGQADVYRAAHPNLARELVIKISRRSLSAAEPDRDRLLAEGKILAELDHPNLARVFDLDFDGDRPFLVMEFVRGCNLRQQAEQRRFDPQQAARLVAKIARALAAAHARGVVHLDLKPSNVVLDERGEPRVIDFGIGRLAGAWVQDRPDADRICGTPGFMAPEQVRGEATDARSDVFALGVLLYYLLVGESPFQASTLAETLARTQQCEINRERLRSAGAPAALQWICCRAMRARPGERYPTAEAMGHELDRFGGRRGRLLAAAGLATAAMLLALAAWAVWPRGGDRIAAGNGEEEAAEPDPYAHFDPNVEVSVWQANLGGVVPLASSLPVYSNDQWQITGRVPAGMHVSLFAFDSAGQLQKLDRCEVVQGKEADRIYYPSKLLAASLSDLPGTEVVLICARRSKPVEVEDIADLFEEGAPWPEIPTAAVVRLDWKDVKLEQGRHRDVARRVAAKFTGYEASLPDEVRERAETLRSALAKRCDYAVGVVFPHAKPPFGARGQGFATKTPDGERIKADVKAADRPPREEFPAEPPRLPPEK